ncbi:MAG: diphthamide biosynthesis enzyme Dph2 [Methanophagales archaeon ANME-1-THS]|nr:MAG: diphthamide biosynthesis enzyme Dph2 [Methanophagales archaeon ANME-1-THS]
MERKPYEFELDKITALIQERGARRVGVQLPEGLKTAATEIATEIAQATGVAVLISGNSCYGACDVDEKLARIVDMLFHFGHAANQFRKSVYGKMLRGEPVLEATCRQKVVFIELRSTVDIKPVVERAVAELKGDSVGLVATVQHVHALPEAKTVLARSGKKVLIGASNNLTYDGQVLGCDFSSARVPCDELLFIGSGRFHPEGIALYTGKRVIAADPFTLQIHIVEPDDLRKKRYGVIARALDAKSFGIIIGLKSGQSDLNEALAAQQKAVEKGLDAYLIAMDEITEARLLGFKVDAFVNTACPRLAEDFVHFNQPILSVNEFEVAIGERNWDEIWQY